MMNEEPTIDRKRNDDPMTSALTRTSAVTRRAVLTGIAAWFFMSPLEAGTDFQSDVLFPMRGENRGLPVVLPVVLTGVDLRLLGTHESRRPAARLLGRPVT